MKIVCLTFDIFNKSKTHLTVKRIIGKPEDTMKLMCIFLGHPYWVFGALENFPLVYFLWSIPINNSKYVFHISNIVLKRSYLSKFPSLAISKVVLHSLIQPSLVVSNWSVF